MLRSWHDLESMALADLGISEGDERVYRFLLGAPLSSVDVLAKALELSESQAKAAVSRIAELGLVSIDSTGSIVTADPHSALDALAERKVLDSLADFQRHAVTRSTLPDVLAELGKTTSGAVFERIISVDAVTARMVEELDRRPAAEVRSSKTQTTLRRFGDAGYMATVLHLRQGTRYRTLVRSALITDPVIAAYYRQLHQIGDVVRVTSDHLQSMSLFDSDRAFVPLEPDNPAAGAMFIRHSGLVATLADLFEQAWRSGLDLDVATNDISATEHQILLVLTETAKDEVAARHLGISVRTFRRHVSDLMERVHADNRFQLAAIAKDKGWL